MKKDNLEIRKEKMEVPSSWTNNYLGKGMKYLSCWGVFLHIFLFCYFFIYFLAAKITIITENFTYLKNVSVQCSTWQNESYRDKGILRGAE